MEIIKQRCHVCGGEMEVLAGTDKNYESIILRQNGKDQPVRWTDPVLSCLNTLCPNYKRWFLSTEYEAKVPRRNTLSLGAGMRRHDGAVHHDRVALPGIDVVHDLTIFPWPWADGWFERIVAFDVVEHLPDLLRSVEECHRILQPGGRLWIHTNDARNWRAFTDPTHVHFCTPETFDFFVPGTFLGDTYHWYTRGKFRKLDCHAEGNELVFELEKI